MRNSFQLQAMPAEFPTRVPPPSSASSLPIGDPRFLVMHAWLPFIALSALLVLTMGLGGDQWLADRMYAFEGGHWALRDAFVTDQLIHKAGRDMDIALWLSVLVAWILTHRPGREHWRAPLAYLLTATALSMACVAWMKSWSNMDCPWDLLRYGGDRPYVGLWQLRPIGLERGSCFPAGHASGGYAWLALYFFLAVVRPQWRWWGLAAGIALGLLFGVSQQLRGAHFLSHDLITAAICWGDALLCFGLFRRRLVQSRWQAAGFGRSTGGAA
ncbi:phosphatase PAP2 family protein [Lysobacter sp.]|uniref:phosphatase PAP2 family protein n=1 Tax=Lysobacter sp. TaxID=72226 RepID=UPI002D6F4F08|nr:phosphatase PAP2 family protein [Lysobacter sp.]HZX77884.1 phosphatase PAP2 family protein [Lysobacter sp.]